MSSDSYYRQQEEQRGETAEILRALSEIDDLPDELQGDSTLGQLVSKLVSTANLTPDQVRSNEWVREYILILYLCKYPDEEGMHGSWRGWAHGDSGQERDPLDSEVRTQIETFISTANLALTRSEDAKVIEESARNVNEQIANDKRENNSSGGGILGRIRG